MAPPLRAAHLPVPMVPWFWQQTALARLIAAAATHLARSGDAGRKAFGLRAMVPRQYMAQLTPDVETFI